ncbi:ankyrin repeat-containing protein At2g01680-like [Panicum hallii]|uniref:ankyrin repeat-containing protein At2g01680-like n=1 Tax=Panicum hallii TaxID=206008 RepID=UPI000DF4D535|nr:ankyrin repeat-containing protein At2g01680-like [Panicum hallii]
MPRAAPSPVDPPLPSHQHQALFAAVRSGDAATVRALLVDAEASGASLPALAGEAATYVAAGAEREEVVRLILSLYEFKAAAVSARLDLDTFHLVAMRGWVIDRD